MWEISASKKVKVKCSRYRLGVPQTVGRGIALLFHDCGTRRGWVVSSTPGRTLPPGKTRYPFYRRLGGPQGRSGRAENPVLTGIRSRIVQPVVIRYNDWATGPTISVSSWFYYKSHIYELFVYICRQSRCICPPDADGNTDLVFMSWGAREEEHRLLSKSQSSVQKLFPKVQQFTVGNQRQTWR